MIEKRVFNQDDLFQMYPDPPKIKTSPTFVTITLIYIEERITVKLPSDASYDTVIYLLHRAIYFHLLGKAITQNINPLLQVALVIGFECEQEQTGEQNPKVWYNFWRGKSNLKSMDVFRCLTLEECDSLDKYHYCGTLIQGQFYSQYLVKSRRDGGYYTMKIHKHKSSDHFESLQTLKQMYASLKHPFIVKLSQAFQTKSHTYFIFDHACTNLEEIFGLYQKLDIDPKNINTIFMEILFASLFLEQSGLICREIRLEDIGVKNNGHIIISQKLLEDTDKPLYQYTTERRQKKVMALRTVLITLFSALSKEKQMAYQENQQIEDLLQFIAYLDVFNEHQKNISHILHHKWCQQQSTQVILSLQMQAFPRKTVPLAFFEDQNDSQKIENISKSEYNSEFYYSCQSYSRPQIQRIFSLYLPQLRKDKNIISDRKFKKIDFIRSKKPKNSYLTQQRAFHNKKCSTLSINRSRKYLNPIIKQTQSPYEQIIRSSHKNSKKKHKFNASYHQ